MTDDTFKASTYATEYDNAAAVHRVLTHLDEFPRANVAALEADHAFLILECAARGLVPRFIERT